jgi:DNA-directed RNA polymerase specialized sigma subunit
MADTIGTDALARIDLLALCGNDEETTILVRRLVGMIDDLAGQHAGNGLSVPSLAAHGCVGLVHASETFDAARGGDFIAHATRETERAMLDALDNRHAAAIQPPNSPDQPPQEIPR